MVALPLLPTPAWQPSPPASPLQTPGSLGFWEGFPPPVGDWVVEGVVVVEGVSLIVNGSIIVGEAGALILRDAEIYMNLSWDGEHRIDVHGNLTVHNTLITAYDAACNHYIRVFSGAKLLVRGSEISHAGYEWGWRGDRSGLWIEANDTVIEDTYIHSNLVGLLLHRSCGSTIAGNTIAGNHLDGLNLNGSCTNTITGNTIANNSYDGLCLTVSCGNTIANNTITGNRNGPHLWCSDGNTITNNTIASNDNDGVWLTVSCGNTIANNTITGNEDGLWLSASHNNTVTGNTVANNAGDGLYSWNSGGNTIADNMIASNGDDGIDLVVSEGNTLTGNTIANNSEEGIRFHFSDDNAVTGNTIKNTYFGVYLLHSEDNVFFLNSFISNKHHVLDLDGSNRWCSPEPICYIYGGRRFCSYMGNYWDNYAGIDFNGDGIGDTPHYGDYSDILDPCPLVGPLQVYNLTGEPAPTPGACVHPLLVGILLALASAGVGVAVLLWLRRKRPQNISPKRGQIPSPRQHQKIAANALGKG